LEIGGKGNKLKTETVL